MTATEPPGGFVGDRANSYDDRIRQLIPGYETLHRLSATLLASLVPEQASILVAGVGTGMEMEAWAPLYPGWRFLGVDPSAEMVAQAKQKLRTLGERSRLQVGTVQELPEETFDGATLLLVLHFLPDDGQKADLLSAIAERLQPGAPFVMATMFGDPASTRHKRMIALTKSWALERGLNPQKAEELCNPARTDLHIVPEERLKILLRDAGFIDVQRFHQGLSVGAWSARAAR